MIKQHKLPTILGILLLIVGVAAGVFLVQREQLFKTSASPEETPQQVRITNISDNSFTVSWVTDKATAGFISYGKSQVKELVAQQASSLASSSFVHHVTAGNLDPETAYLFEIGSGTNTFDSNGQPYKIQTAPVGAIPPLPDVVFGKVNNSSGTPARGAIVYITVPGVTPLSVLTDSKGGWTVPLSNARSSNLTGYASYDSKKTPIEILVQAGGGQLATAKVLTKAAHPVPEITLSENHDFTDVEPLDGDQLPTSTFDLPEDTLDSSSSSSRFSVEDDVTETTESTSQVKLTTPSESESINTNKPQFSGTGTPGTPFTITVESPTTYSDEVVVGTSGSWKWTPPEILEPGDHTITIAWKNESGQTVETKRAFTVLAAGESDLPSFSASPSATEATPSPTPSPKATPSPTPSPSPSPRISIPSTESGVPVSGNLTPMLGSIIMGLVLILVGIFLPSTKVF